MTTSNIKRSVHKRIKHTNVDTIIIDSKMLQFFQLAFGILEVYNKNPNHIEEAIIQEVEQVLYAAILLLTFPMFFCFLFLTPPFPFPFS